MSIKHNCRSYFFFKSKSLNKSWMAGETNGWWSPRNFFESNILFVKSFWVHSMEKHPDSVAMFDLSLFVMLTYPMTDPGMYAIYGLPWTPSTKTPVMLDHVSINLPLTWIRHGICWHLFTTASSNEIGPGPQKNQACITHCVMGRDAEGRVRPMCPLQFLGDVENFLAFFKGKIPGTIGKNRWNICENYPLVIKYIRNLSFSYESYPVLRKRRWHICESCALVIKYGCWKSPMRLDDFSKLHLVWGFPEGTLVFVGGRGNFFCTGCEYSLGMYYVILWYFLVGIMNLP